MKTSLRNFGQSLVRQVAVGTLGLGLSFSAFAYAQGETGQDPRHLQLMQEVSQMENSITQSSITRQLTERERMEKLLWLNRAKAEIADGNYRTAAEWIRKVGRDLYPMPSSRIKGDQVGYSEKAWVSEMERAIASIFPEARRILNESLLPETSKVAYAQRLQVISTEVEQSFGDWHQVAVTGLQGQAQVSDALSRLEKTYISLQRVVAELRTGREFFVEQTALEGERAWQDAQRSFDERMLMSRMILIEAETDDIDTKALEESMGRSQALFFQASALAEQSEWKEAMSMMSVAYLDMETAWKSLGIEV